MSVGGAGMVRRRPHGWMPETLRAGLCLALCVGLCLGLASCSRTPHHAAMSNPATSRETGGMGDLPTRIRLPETVSLAFTPPPAGAPPQAEVVYAVQQAIKAQLHAMYAGNPGDPLLHRYWSGNAYQQVAGQVQQWMHLGNEPVGVVVVNRARVDQLAPTSASVTYCISLTGLLRGKRKTHALSEPVEPKGTPGTRETLTLRSQSPHMWSVVDIHDIAQSPQCVAGHHG